MVNSITSNMAATLFGGGTTFTTGVDSSLLTAWTKAKAGIGVNTTTATQDPNAPIAPVWTPGVSPADSVLVQRALSSKAFFDVNAKLYTDLGATGDYQKLFALYSGLSTLKALAGRAEDTTLSAVDQTLTNAAFARGMKELEAFFAQQQFEDIRLAQGDRVDAAQTTMAIPSKSEDYVTGYIHRGGLYDKLAGLDPNAQFTITATSAAGTVRNVAIDLSQMGSVTRTFSNVISFINNKLSAAGASSRLEAADITPKETTVMVAGNPVTTRYTGLKQYALKVDVRANEKIAFAATSAEPSFYALGGTGSGTRLVKLTDVGGEAGQPMWFERPASTTDATGAYVSEGWFGTDTSPAGAWEQRSNALASTSGTNKYEDTLRAAGEAVLKIDAADGRVFTIAAAWRSEDLEAWRTRSGESEERAMLDDLAERMTQLMHEQGIAAGVDVWEDNGKLGLSVFSADGLRASSLSIGKDTTALETIAQPDMVGGLRDGVFARRFETDAVAATGDLFVDDQRFTFTTGSTTQSITIDGGDDGITGAALITKLNDQLRQKGISAAASLVDDGGVLKVQIDALHNVTAVTATINGDAHESVLQAPGAWANGGLPVATAGQPFGDAVRTYGAAASPLLSETGAIDLAIVVATPTGNKTVNVSISALERANNPDASPGEWNALFQDRLATALNAAGVYVSASSDLTQWSAAEGAGQRIQSVTVNGNAMSLTSGAPSFALGGAFSAERSFTSDQAATGVSDTIAALQSNQNVSVTIDTVWGPRTISAALQVGDPPTLESAALRLNEALAAQGYDAGVAAAALSGSGAGLRIVTGGSHTVRGVSNISLGGEAHTASLDPIDVLSYVNDPNGAARVVDRAARGATVTQTIAADSTFTAPSANASGWFPGRSFDVSIGGGLQIATANQVATGADGSVYILANLGGDSAGSAIKGARDVALLKYDSAGKLAFTEMLGASESANGFALAVSADGKVAVAGAVEGSLSNAAAAKGKTDSFVTVFDSNGKELWTARRGATGADQVNAISFASNGSLIVAGQTESALVGQSAIGGADGYVRGYSAGGAELFTKQFGTTGADATTALAVRDNGSGGFDIFTGGVESNRGVVRSFTYSPGNGFTTGATRDIGYFYKGSINAIAVDGSSLYVGGEIGADRLTLGAPASAAVAGQEGFVARMNVNLASTSLDRASYLGSAGDDVVKSLAVVNGEVYAAGVTTGVIAGQGASGTKSSFITRLADDGEAAWTRAFNSVGGMFTLSALAVDTSGASALDVLGLPRGQVATSDNNYLVNRSALRAGDEFQIGVDGRRLATIRIGEKDTLASLVNTINRAIAGAGRATILKEDGVERLKIEPLAGKAVRIEDGREGRDALGALGLKRGLVAVNATGRGAIKTYGLGLLAADLRLDSKANITSTKAELSAAISIVRQAYDTLLNPNAKELTDEEKALQQRRQNAGAAPSYLSDQLANYQAALARLGGS